MVFKSATLYFKEYCNSSSIQVFRYLVENNRSGFERFCWILIFVANINVCLLIINEILHKWAENAVFITPASRTVSIYDLPFPAVTICPQSKIRKSELESTRSKHLPMLCRKPEAGDGDPEINETEEMFSWFDAVRPDLKLPKFPLVLTDQGICYTFNLLDRSRIFKKGVQHHGDFYANRFENDWSVEKGYDKEASSKTFPFRAKLLGYDADDDFQLRIFLRNEDLDHGCNCQDDDCQGVRIQLHTPDSVPHFVKNFFELSLNQTVKAVVRPRLTVASDSIKKYGVDVRGCYFEPERQLRFFKKYTFQNCELECVTNYTLALCGCVDFYMPAENGTRICGPSKRPCARTASGLSKTDSIFQKSEDSVFLGELRQFENNRTGGVIKFERCGCLPTCTELKYETEISRTATDFEKYVKKGSWYGLENRSHVSVLKIAFETNQLEVWPFVRKELYGPTDFLADCGGLLSLFCGISVSSLIEIVYFMAEKVVFGLKKNVRSLSGTVNEKLATFDGFAGF